MNDGSVSAFGHTRPTPVNFRDVFIPPSKSARDVDHERQLHRRKVLEVRFTSALLTLFYHNPPSV